MRYSTRYSSASSMRLVTAALLARAATACPIGWTPSPNSRACFKVPPERSTSLFRCVELCKAHGGAPACIGSAEENRHVTAGLAATEGLWLGLYQNETGLGPAKGWGRCVAGDATSFTNWHEGQPDDYHGYQQDCAWVDASTGWWRALPCEHRIGDVRFDTFPRLLVELPCLCANGNASAAFADDRKALEATSGYNQRLRMERTTIAFSAAVAIAVLPSLLLLGRTGWRRLRRGVDAAPSTGGQGAASSAAAKGALRAARASAAARRLRVSFVMGQAGWALLVIGMTPMCMRSTAHSIGDDVRDATVWLVPLSACLILLALFPTDARAIRVVCALILVLWTGFGALFIAETLATAGRHLASYAYGFSNAALFAAGAAALAPTLRCRGDRAMQPRPALRRLWAASRLYILGMGVINSWYGAARFVQGGYHAAYLSTVGWSATALLLAALATPRNRGRIHRRLGRLGGRGTEAEEAAAVAALVGSSSAPDAALERATKLLRCLPASQLHATDLADNMVAPPAGPTLHARTEPAAMGEVTAFLSHSWSDEKEAPGAKHALVSRWARRRQETTGKEPTLWLVSRSLPLLLYTPSYHSYHVHARDEIICIRAAPHRTRRASTRATSSSRSPACPSSSRAARRCSSWPGPPTAHDCGASWSSSRSLEVSACCTHIRTLLDRSRATIESTILRSSQH